jgi:hypothetical protein
VACALIATPFRQAGELFTTAADADTGSIRQALETMRSWTLGAFILGGVLWLGAWQAARKRGQKENLLVDRPEAQAALLASSSSLPLVIDMTRGGTSLRDLAGVAGHPLLGRVFAAIADWPMPKRSLGDEKRYEASLHRHFLAALGDSAPERQFPLGERTDPNRGRADLVVGKAVLIELKRGWGATTVDRAVGQLRKYAEHWKERGPMILLLFEVDPSLVEPRLALQLQAIRAVVPCIAIIAKAA